MAFLHVPENAEIVAPPDHEEAVEREEDALVLLFMCCHEALSDASAIALTLRAVGGLTTAEIAGAFLVPEATMAQRISRAKQTIKASGVPFALPKEEERDRRGRRPSLPPRGLANREPARARLPPHPRRAAGEGDDRRGRSLAREARREPARESGPLE